MLWQYAVFGAIGLIFKLQRLELAGRGQAGSGHPKATTGPLFMGIADGSAPPRRCRFRSQDLSINYVVQAFAQTRQ